VSALEAPIASLQIDFLSLPLILSRSHRDGAAQSSIGPDGNVTGVSLMPQKLQAA